MLKNGKEIFLKKSGDILMILESYVVEQNLFLPKQPIIILVSDDDENLPEISELQETLETTENADTGDTLM